VDDKNKNKNGKFDDRKRRISRAKYRDMGFAEKKDNFMYILCERLPNVCSVKQYFDSFL
jgi:hypothetical protein